MKFRTELELSSSDYKIRHSTQIMGIGSCFVDETGRKLRNSKFKTLINPFGTLFHPQAIENALSRILAMDRYTTDEIFNYNELYFSWDHHTSFSRTSVREALENINAELEKANNFIQNTDCVLLTFGTAWVYQIKDNGLSVANCHKVPAHIFEKTLLTEKQLRTSFKNCFELILDINPKAKIIATISPVRHTKDGIVENSLSKSRLISALHDVVDSCENADYFPAFELVNDDLRDYRFYEADLVHPNQIAVDYIWGKFSSVYFDNETIQQIETANKIKNALGHRPFNPGTIAYREFLYKTKKLIESIESQFPKDSFLEEKTKINDLNKLC